MLYFIAWLTDFAALLFVFAGTRYLAERGDSAFVLGCLGASFFLASAISNSCSGHVADRVGRRRVAMCGTGLFFASLCGVAYFRPESWFFYAAYSSVGIAVGMIFPPIMAWLGHGKSGRAASRTYLFFCLAFNMGIVSAQLSGGWMFEQLGSRAPLLVAIGLTTVSFASLCFLKEPASGVTNVTPSGTDDRSVLPDDGRLARAFARLTWIANFGGMFSMSIVWFLFPKLVVHLDVRADGHGVILAVGRVVVMSTFCVMHFFPFWRYRFEFAAVAQLLGIGGLLGVCVSNSSLGLALGIAALSALMGYNYFSSLYYNMAGNHSQRKGRAFGFNEASLAFGAVGGSFFGGIVAADVGNRAPFLMAAILMAAILLVQVVIYWRLMRPNRMQPAEHEHVTAVNNCDEPSRALP